MRNIIKFTIGLPLILAFSMIMLFMMFICYILDDDMTLAKDDLKRIWSIKKTG